MLLFCQVHYYIVDTAVFPELLILPGLGIFDEIFSTGRKNGALASQEFSK
jgi:hypothetical protein